MNTLLQKAISVFKRKRRQFFLTGAGDLEKKYAFIGAGSHALQNLFPCIFFLGVPLSMIVSKGGKSAAQLAKRFAGCNGTNDLNSVLTNPQITGVFLCINPADHFNVAKSLLQHQKNVFVEKPPCQTLEQLDELISLQNEGKCMVGLQRRFCTINKFLLKKLKKAETYSCRFLFGEYSEGDPILNLFIHPIDNVIYLFGEAKLLHVSKVGNGTKITIFLMLQHVSGVTGFLELSTNHSWSNPVDSLEINSREEILQANYPNSLKGILKPASLLNIPLDRVFSRPLTSKSYFSERAILPSAETNTLAMAGFLSEIKEFIRTVEENVVSKSNITTLRNTYSIIEAVQKA